MSWSKHTFQATVQSLFCSVVIYSQAAFIVRYTSIFSFLKSTTYKSISESTIQLQNVVCTHQNSSLESTFEILFFSSQYKSFWV